MNSSELSQAFVLHSRPFKESSLIVDLFTLDHGRCNVLARGVRGSKKSNKRALLQPFQPLSVSWVGRSELKTLKHVEAEGLPFFLAGIPSMSGLYMNELLIKLLIHWDPHPDIFSIYQYSLQRLHQKEQPSIILREFELNLLEELGYGVDWLSDVHGDLIEKHNDYGFIPEQGFIPLLQAPKHSLKVSGKHIIAVAEKDWSTSGSLALVRKVCRVIIDPLVGYKELNSRKLLQQTLAIHP